MKSDKPIKIVAFNKSADTVKVLLDLVGAGIELIPDFPPYHDHESATYWLLPVYATNDASVLNVMNVVDVVNIFNENDLPPW